jgi:ubiquinone/menaquinone biosynthesis C-methylase UbiE
MSLSPDLHLRFKEQAAWTLDSQKQFLQDSGIHSNSKLLEVGCGTGAVLSSIRSLMDANLFGLDINLNMLRTAYEELPDANLTCADANLLSFPRDYFDAVICHYFLLWIRKPEAVIHEFMRIARPGGVIALLAEPDYGSRIDYPVLLEKAGKLQRDSLIRQGANPDIGRRTGELLSNSGCKNISTGILGSFISAKSFSKPSKEQFILQSDISGMTNPHELNELLKVDNESIQNHSRVQFIPTFFGWGFKPEKN